ncbi:MAG: DUF1275 family protein [Gemmatimonadaceae bacterium]|nr:DUF1275 family protein [Gemmatimonadaceae bacterium]
MRADLHLGAGLAFVAGATNAGAYLAVQQYTSHMTGIVSTVADAVVLGDRRGLVLDGDGRPGSPSSPPVPRRQRAW